MAPLPLIGFSIPPPPVVQSMLTRAARVTSLRFDPGGRGDGAGSGGAVGAGEGVDEGFGAGSGDAEGTSSGVLSDSSSRFFSGSGGRAGVSGARMRGVSGCGRGEGISDEEVGEKIRESPIPIFAAKPPISFQKSMRRVYPRASFL